ncbi:MAG: cold shock domain-containing protein [Actinomycetales bacterium]|nr:cold shock domain-containing protein [Actinomycetales bacterium]
MPTGKVKFFDEAKGFGFIASDEGDEVFLHASALPEGTSSIRPGARVEFSVFSGKRGAQAMSLRVLEAPVSLAKAGRKPADEMAVVVEDLIRLLDSLTSANRFNYPEASKGRKIAALLRKVADELDA